MQSKKTIRGVRDGAEEYREAQAGAGGSLAVTVQRTGGIWHGYVEGHPEVDERGLTEEMARVKAERAVERLRENGVPSEPVRGSRNDRWAVGGKKSPLTVK
jgi:hypothetical protein